MAVTRNLGAMNILDAEKVTSRPPLRQNTFVIEDRNVMRLGEGGGNDGTRNSQKSPSSEKSNGQRSSPIRLTNGGGSTGAKKPPMTMKSGTVTSKTDSGLMRVDGE